MAPKKITSKMKSFLEEAKDRVETAKEKALETKEKAEETIKENPFASIAVAAAIGALVALGVSAITRKRRNSWLDNLREYL